MKNQVSRYLKSVLLTALAVIVIYTSHAQTCTLPDATVTSTNQVLNSYYPGTTAALAANATRVNIGAVRGVSAGITRGDVLILMQMQGSTINTNNSNSYGDGVSGNPANGFLTSIAGTYEFVVAANNVASSGGTLYFTKPITNAYTASAFGTNGQYTYQLIKVARYNNLTINTSSSISGSTWNGATGGVIAVDVTGTFNMNSRNINADAIGFRGGGGRELFDEGSGNNTDIRTLSTRDHNGSKGEGIAGTPRYMYYNSVLTNNTVEGYPNGSYANGAPANAGGGGTDGSPSVNDQNSGGGGGANGGNGGRGGFSWSSQLDVGGFGGAAPSFLSVNRFIMGGGGGAGTNNNGSKFGSGANVSVDAGLWSSGGIGGGIVFLTVNTISNAGTITAQGGYGLSADNDGGGGGGAGGTVYVSSTGSLTNLIVNVNGGDGGNTVNYSNSSAEDHGPGGGGGGGAIYTTSAVSVSSTRNGGANGRTRQLGADYGAIDGSIGIINQAVTKIIYPPISACDIDDDDDGIPDLIESSNVDPLADADNDGIPNVYDSSPGSGMPAWVDSDSDGVNDNYDRDLDGIINALDLDSDNDGIPDVIESYGVDENGDGIIDNFTDTNNDGLSQNAQSNGVAGLGAQDLDGDGIPNFLDLDSDNDGIPDILEAGGVDSNNDGLVDSFTDADKNGWHDNYEGSTNALIKSGPDTGADGKADSWPNKNIDRMTYPNPYDLDSDGDGISDYEESGLRTALGGASPFATIATGTLGTDGWSNSVDALSSITFTNSDSHGSPDYLDIDADNDGITDNVEAMATNSYIQSTDTDSDGDGLVDAYDSNDAAFGGNALTPFNFDGDSLPDYRDTDTDNDGVPDRNEGDRDFKVLSQATINATADTDGDGLVDYFDTYDASTAAPGSLFKNYSMSNMGAGGTLDGPTPSGSTVELQKSNPNGDRDWRNVSILPLYIFNFYGSLKNETVVLNWQTRSEQGVGFYQVERSLDGTNFNQLTTITGKNIPIANYDYNDAVNGVAHKGILFYRVKQIQLDGAIHYSSVITIRVQEIQVGGIKLYPNPTSNNATLQINSIKNMSALVIITDVSGKQLSLQPTSLVKGSNFIPLNGINLLQSGTYVVCIKGDGMFQTQKIIKK
jgi:hypothetical protein